MTAVCHCDTSVPFSLQRYDTDVCVLCMLKYDYKLNSVALVRERTIPTIPYCRSMIIRTNFMMLQMKFVT